MSVFPSFQLKSFNFILPYILSFNNFFHNKHLDISFIFYYNKLNKAMMICINCKVIMLHPIHD